MDKPGQAAMAERGSPVRFRLDRQELDRRWAMARETMRTAGLDAVVALGFDDSLSGYPRWFCDFGSIAYMKVVIFYADGPMTTIEHGARGAIREVDPASADTPGVGRIVTASSFKSVAATFDQEARLVAADLAARNARRVGLLRQGGMPSAFVDHLRQFEPALAISDETDRFDALKAVKSSYELVLLREACAVQDAVFATVLEQVRPGVREVDLLSLAERELRLHGALDGTLASGSAPLGQSAHLRGWRMQNRVLEQGDCFTLLLELSSEAGYYGEMARQVVIGKADQATRDAFAIVCEAQDAAVALMRPGTLCSDIAKAHDAFMAARGHGPELRVFSHSQGYDMVERPLIRADETMALQANMFVSCHPAIATPSSFVFLCDNFIVHADRPAERIHTTPRELFEV